MVCNTSEQVPVETVVVDAAEMEAQNKFSALMKSVTTSPTTDARRAAANELAELVKSTGVSSLTKYKVLDAIKTAAEDKKQQNAREGAMLAITALAEKVGRPAEPFFVSQLPLVLEALADKMAFVRTQAEIAGRAVLTAASPYALKAILTLLYAGLDNSRKWQTKSGSLALMGMLTTTAPAQFKQALPDVIPIVSDAMWDTKPEVKAAAQAAMKEVCGVVNNMDIEPFIPELIACIADPTRVPETVYKLAATTFVQTVDGPTLAIMVPLLVRALAERPTAVKRQTTVIIDNMCKLVENPADAHQFLPKLLPGVDKIIETQADPECRSVAERARSTLIKVGGGVDEKTVEENKRPALDAFVLSTLQELVPTDKAPAVTVDYVANLCARIVDVQNFDFDEWSAQAFTPYLLPFLGKDECESILRTLVAKCQSQAARRNTTEEVEVDEGEVLCNCEFSLAYGGMMLLNKTYLKLLRGQRYGLCGPNGVGKSTLMRAIANGQVEGFPSPDELKTVFVEHNLQAEEAELPVIEFMFADPSLKDTPRDEVQKTLGSVGFTPQMQQQAVGSLSGGWKMKLELARAMLMHADILLLDEPTNHLDVANVAWLTNYLKSLTNVTSMIVSHDSGFLDDVCSNIIHYENRKLKTYKGNLSDFVKVKPEARSYYELAATPLKYVFPEPGFLEGIKSKGKAILKMSKVSYTYPGAPKPSISGATVQVSLSSRIAVLGPNGAGKSTLIKVMTGEVVPQVGEVWKHPNLRVAYLAQHAFHHVEQHLDKTPNQYIQWRFNGGEDREHLSKDSRQITKEEEEAMAKQVVWDGQKLRVERIFGRRKMKNTYEYEIKWIGLPYDKNSWVPRTDLEKWGFEKALQRYDDREAALAGSYKKPLTQVSIEKHLKDFGLEAEFATHSRIRGLSGGQKVKVVLGAAMWLNPHILVLDEPTNYLDRDSLGALANAIKEFGGGVVMITHNREFSSALCPETWTVENGKIVVLGSSDEPGEKIDTGAFVEPTENLDAFGNVEKVKAAKKQLSRKEQKALEKRRANAKKNGMKLSDDEDDF